MQIFIEPKGAHLVDQDRWKEDFLKQLETDAKMHLLFQGKDYRVFGLPFFNDAAPVVNDFRDCFGAKLGVDRKA